MAIIKPPITDAIDVLEAAISCIGDRAAERDSESERSMGKCVEAFNAIYKTNLSVEAGWIFMTLLKIARSSNGAFRLDDYIDMAAYAGLAGEEALHRNAHVQ